MRSPQPPLSLRADTVAAVREALVGWYREHGRDLPWRRTRDPYAVLVSELMLQQQTVRHVVPVYLRFLERFPDLAALAGASRAEVIRVWQPLGRYASAVRLHAIAQSLTGEAGGVVPGEVEALLALRGIGRYTAGAIVCFAFGVPAPLVDTNVRRVLGRLFGAAATRAGAEDGEQRSGPGEQERLAWRLAEALLPQTGAYEWNQGLLDLGAAVCIARRPRCAGCPVASWCDYRSRLIAGDPSQDPPLGRPGVAEARAPWRLTSQESPPAPPVPPAPAPAAARSPRFEGSRRWYRGQIMQALCALPPGEALPVTALAQRLLPDVSPEGLALLDDLVAALTKDGLLRHETRADGALWLTLPE